MPALRDWQNFYLLTGTAAATLIGLLFVALSISVGVNLAMRRITNAIDTFVTPILLSYGQVFFLSCLGIIPFQGALVLGGIVLALGSANSVLALWVAWRMLVLHRDERDRGHWVWHALLPFLAGILLVGTALGILNGNSLAPAGLAIADLACLVVGMRNSWTLTIWLILYRTQGSDASAEKQPEQIDAASLFE
ncbi:MAG TPA: hypothetical protein VKT82_09065 [Ktedonobacterales bacterium]|nr:hypothetical protein [Ktedonobacterales bacterium]